VLPSIVVSMLKKSNELFIVSQAPHTWLALVSDL